MTIIRYLVFNIVSFRFGLVVYTANENQNHYLRFLLKSLFLIYRIIMEEKENKLINTIEAINYFENKRRRTYPNMKIYLNELMNAVEDDLFADVFAD